LDPISGYLCAIENALNGGHLPSLNFGPLNENWPVRTLVSQIISHLEEKGIKLEIEIHSSSDKDIESTALNLNSSTAQSQLNWRPLWNQEKAIVKSIDWWCGLIFKNESALRLTIENIKEYLGEESNS
jgi:CDP-glucose 4,6-dehydratase